MTPRAFSLRQTWTTAVILGFFYFRILFRLPLSCESFALRHLRRCALCSSLPSRRVRSIFSVLVRGCVHRTP